MSFHSYLSAMVGSTEAACTAGPMPARTPTAAATTMASVTVGHENTGETLSAEPPAKAAAECQDRARGAPDEAR